MAHPQPASTPDAHQQRIAQLRARRRARLRWLAIRSVFAGGALVLLAAGVLSWLLMTLGGRDFLLAQIQARLPADASFTWQRAQGPVSGPLTLHGVHFAWHGTVFDARRVTLDPDIRPLLGRVLRLDTLQVEGAVLQLPRDDAPFELPRWPESLPQIDLPLGLQADRIEVDGLRVLRAGDATVATAPTGTVPATSTATANAAASTRLIDIRSLRGGIDARRGHLHLEHIVVDSDRGRFTAHGDYQPADDYATDLTLSALLPAPRGQTRPCLGAVARGTLAHMDVAIAGNAPGPLHAQLSLRGRDQPRWTLRANSRALDSVLLAGGAANAGTPGTPLSFTLSADGNGGAASVRGQLSRGDLSLRLQPSQLRVADQRLTVAPLVVDAFGGRLHARGHADFSDPGNADFKFGIVARGLAFAAQDDAPGIGVDATFGVAGTAARWAAIGNANVRRDDHSARIAFDARGDADGAVLRKLHAAMPTGSLDARGRVGWTPALQWDLDATLAGFDPGYFAPDWPGAVNATLASEGRRRSDGGLEATLDAHAIGGHLRGRKLDGHATLALHGAADAAARSAFDGDIALRIGDSRIDAHGRVADTLQVDARLAPLQLADLLPGTAGRLQGTLTLRGQRNAPDLAIDLDGNGLQYRDYRAASLSAHGRLPWHGDGSLHLAARTLQAGIALDQLQLDARGALTQLQFDANTGSELGTLALSGALARNGNRWQASLANLHLAPATGADWRLQSPARIAVAGHHWTVSHSCLAATGGGHLCVEADWPRTGVAIDSDALPLALLAPYLPARAGDRRWTLDGNIALDARLRPSGNAYAGHVQLRSASGHLRGSQRARRDIVAYRDLALDADFDANRIHASAQAVLDDNGRLDAEANTGWDAYSPLSGRIALDTDALAWLELFSPDILDPRGRLHADIALAGTRAAPALGGQARLDEFSTELPSLGIVLERGTLQLDAQPDGSARINGQVASGDGILRVDGSLSWQDDTQPLQLHVSGENVLVANTRDLHAVASPDLTVRYTAAQPLAVTGTVEVPSALLDLERLDEGVPVSDDVVVLDPVDPEDTGAPLPLDLDLTLALGDDVRLKGFGLDGTLGGRLRVRATPGRDMRATGLLEAGGKYEAYGQKLTITRGRLQWSNSPIDDPLLDIRAERRIEAQDITAGITVTGRATAPQADVWTDPATTQSDALSYLALGRPSASLSGSEGRQLDAASAALNAGGNLLAGQLGSKLGLDDAGIMDSRTLGGSVLGIGKRLSPRLYVGFGVSLLGSGEVLTLKYLLGKGFDMAIESSSIESRASLNWRKEK